jgi:hypothetical protein
MSKAEVLSETGMKPGHAARLLAAFAQTLVPASKAPSTASGPNLPTNGSKSPESAKEKVTWLVVRDEIKALEDWQATKTGSCCGVESFIKEFNKPYSKVAMLRWKKWIKTVECAGVCLLYSLL